MQPTTTSLLLVILGKKGAKKEVVAAATVTSLLVRVDWPQLMSFHPRKGQEDAMNYWYLHSGLRIESRSPIYDARNPFEIYGERYLF